MRIGLNSNTPNYYALTGKINPLSEIMNAGVLTSGNVYWVKASTDTDYYDLFHSVGKQYVFDNIQDAINACTSDQNDYVFVCPKADGTPWDLTAAIDLDEDNVHLISVGYNATNIGYSNTLRGYASTVAHDDEFLYVTGNNCEVAGFRLLGTGAATAASGVTGTIDNALLYVNADNVWVHDCHVEYSGSAATAWDKLGKGMIAVGGGKNGARFDNVTYYGGTTNAGTPTIINIGAESRDATFKDCTFVWKGVDTDTANIRVGTGDIGLLLFDRCRFVNFNHATAPDSLCVGNVTTEEGVVLFDHCAAVGITAMGTDAEVFVVPGQGGGTIANLLENPGLAIPGTALLPTT